jgi:hypothetical protein
VYQPRPLQPALPVRHPNPENLGQNALHLYNGRAQARENGAKRIQQKVREIFRGKERPWRRESGVRRDRKHRRERTRQKVGQTVNSFSIEKEKTLETESQHKRHRKRDRKDRAIKYGISTGNEE